MTEALSPFSEALRLEIEARRGTGRKKSPTQEEIADAIGRTQPYVSDRINGVHPWTTTDLDRLAPLFGETPFSLIAAARDRRPAGDLPRIGKGVGGSAESENFTVESAPPALPTAAKTGRKKSED